MISGREKHRDKENTSDLPSACNHYKQIPTWLAGPRDMSLWKNINVFSPRGRCCGMADRWLLDCY